MDRSLHPNLARIAAAYDDVMHNFRAGRLTPAEARRRVLTLVARDDQGLEWSINPDSGKWQYRSHFGDLTEATPPAYGVAGFSPADLGSGLPSAADRQVNLYEIDQHALYSPGQLSGSTLLTGATTGRNGRAGKVKLLVLLAAIAAAGTAWLLLFA